MGKRLYVGNLPFSVDREALRALFAGQGTITDVHVASDRETGRSRGFGFISFATDEEAEAAAKALNGHSVDGRALVVNVARERGSGPPPGGRADRGDGPPRFSGPRPGAPAQRFPPRPAPGFDGPPGLPPEEEETRRTRHRSPKPKKPDSREKERAPRQRQTDDEEARGGGSWRKWLDYEDDES